MTTKTLILASLISATFISCAKTPSDSGVGGISELTPFTANGQERGNGTDTGLAVDALAWFFGASKTFTYCVEVDSKFGVSESEARVAIEESLAEWATYHQERSWHKKLATKSKYESQCSSSTDLKFIMGGAIPTGDRANTHVGVAVKTKHDKQKAWGQGYIWLASQGAMTNENGVLPNWTPGSVKAILLHEIGHVYGVAHVDGTIMEESAGIWALGNTLNGQTVTIDGENVLVAPPTGLQGTLGLESTEAPELSLVPFGNPIENFELLTGRKPVGAIAANLIVNPSVDGGQLQVTDSKGISTFKLQAYEWESVPFTRGGKSVFLTQDETELFFSDASYEVTANFKIETATGKVLTLALHYNSITGFKYKGAKGAGGYETLGLTLKAFTENGPIYLFTSLVHRYSRGSGPE